MRRRGRPRHPDILTPREWEVLELLRAGLSNPEIAERLGIGREGVKYHVSEILSKLGVPSREEAARWQPEEAPSWRRRALAPLLLWRGARAGRVAGAIAAGLVIAVAAGLGLLLWTLLRTDGGGVTPQATLTAGGDHTCLSSSTGGLRCWGRNDSGQLGDGTITSRSTPVDVTGLAGNVASVAAGGNSGFEHTCAVTAAGGVSCWGNNVDGELGDGRACGFSCPEPVSVTGLDSGVLSLSAGATHTCTLTAAGGVLCWGYNQSGQLGTGSTEGPENCGPPGGDIPCATTPEPVPGLEGGVQAVAAGADYTCALLTAGTVTCWGGGSATPEAVPGLTDIVALAAGGGNFGNEFTCALTEAGAVLCWGDNESGELGDGTTDDSPTPVPVAGLDGGVAAIAAGGAHACALTAAGDIVCWGSNQYGQLGNGTYTGPEQCFVASCSPTPVAVQELAGATAIAAGGSHTCALDAAGGAMCWGLTESGQAGLGPSAAADCGLAPCTTTPVSVRLSGPPGPTPTLDLVDGHPVGFVAYTLDDALFLTRVYLSCPPYCTFLPDTLEYVETTVGEARDLFDPEQEQINWTVPDKFAAWVLVSTGEFAYLNRLSGESTSYTTAWVVIPMGVPGIHGQLSNETYDLSSLGTVETMTEGLPAFGEPAP